MVLRHTDVFRFCVVGFLLLVGACSVGAQSKVARAQDQLPPTYMPSGREMYKQYCSACHGATAKGDGPAAYALKIPRRISPRWPSVTWVSSPPITSRRYCSSGPA